MQQSQVELDELKQQDADASEGLDFDSDEYSIGGSVNLYERAQHVLPGGTTRVTVKRTPVPIYMERGDGAYMFDVDGNRYLDFLGNYTALIHGHAFAPITEALKAQLDKGSCYANPTVTEIKLAELITNRVPAVDKIRFTNSGTEAVLFAVKAARSYTGRSKIAKLEGAYHGAYDWVEVSEASTPENWGGKLPASTSFYEGMPASVLAETVVLPLNDIETSLNLILQNADQLACILVDMMPSRAGLMRLSSGYLEMLSKVAREKGILLISDEVLNFRYGHEGISAAFSFAPDLITFGKIIGGGLPVGAIGGSAEVMSVFDSSKGRPSVPHGGTFAANPLSMIAGLVCMEHLTPDVYRHLNALGDRMRTGMTTIFKKLGLPMSVSGEGSIFRIHLLPEQPKTSREAFTKPKAEKLHKDISQTMLVNGVVIPADTSACCSTPMTIKDIDFFLSTFESCLISIPDFNDRLLASQIEREI